MKLTKQHLHLAIVGILLTSGVATYITMAEEAPQGIYQPSRLSTGNLDLELNTGVGYKLPHGAISWAGYKLQTNLPNWGTRDCLDLGPEAFYPAPSFATRQTAFGEYSERGPRNHTSTAKWALKTIATLHPQYFVEFGRGQARGLEPTEYEALYVAFCDPETITAAVAYSASAAEWSTPNNPKWYRTGPGWTANGWAGLVDKLSKPNKYVDMRAKAEMAQTIIVPQVLLKIDSGQWYPPDTVDGVKTIYGGVTAEFCRHHEAKPRRIAKELREACDG